MSSARHSRVTRKSLASDSIRVVRGQLRASSYMYEREHISSIWLRGQVPRGKVRSREQLREQAFARLLVLFPSSIAPTVAILLPSPSSYCRCPVQHWIYPGSLKQSEQLVSLHFFCDCHSMHSSIREYARTRLRVSVKR